MDHAPAAVSMDLGAGPHPEALYRADGVFETLDHPGTLTDRQVSAYQEQGFLVVGSALDSKQVAEAVAALDALISLRVKDFAAEDLHVEATAAERYSSMSASERRDTVRKVCRFTVHELRMAALASHKNIQGIAARLFGGPVSMIQNMALLKPPYHGREKPWHQDHAYFNYPTTTRVVGVWIALDEARTDNGCMYVLSGWHHRGPIIHFQRRDWQICDDMILNCSEGRCVAVPMAPGAALFFDSFLPHGTPLNASPHRRRAIQFHYVCVDATRCDDEKRMEVFGSEGKNVKC